MERCVFGGPRWAFLIMVFGAASGCNAILGNEEPAHRDEGDCAGGASTAIKGCGGGLAWPHWAPEKAKTYSPTAETVHDSVTGLLWQREVPPDSYTWQEAKEYCEALTLGGHCDWRLPSRIELGSIVNYVVRDPAINTAAFPNTPSESFWASSAYASDPNQAWTVGFLEGDVVAGDVSTASRVRCVR